MRKLLSIFLLLALCTPTAFAAPVVGTSSAVRGKVFVSTNGAQRSAKVRDAIKLQDKVLTKDDSALQILLLDRSTFTVGQNCNMVIDRFVYDPATDVGTVSAKVTKGAFRFMSGRIGKKSPTNATVSTPSATIGIRGTFFEGIVGEDAVALAALAGVQSGQTIFAQASLVALRGPGRGRNTLDKPGVIEVSNSGGSITLLQPGYAAFVPAEGVAPVGPFKLTDEMQDYLNFFLRSEPNGPPVNPVQITAPVSTSGQDQFETPADIIDDVTNPTNEGPNDPTVPQQPPEMTTPPSTNDNTLVCLSFNEQTNQCEVFGTP